MSELRTEGRVGPSVRLVLSCGGCRYERSESYRVQGDSGHDVYCDHPSMGGKHVGDTTWTTPEWCPLRVEAIAELIRAASGEGEEA